MLLGLATALAIQPPDPPEPWDIEAVGHDNNFVNHRDTTYNIPSAQLAERMRGGQPPAKRQSLHATTGEVDSLDGSASFHQFEDIGRAGFLNVRTRSCHQCDECWAGNSAACENEDVCGPVKLVEITCKAAVERPLTRSMLASEGIELSNGVEKGDFICIELDSLHEPYIICRALGGVEAWPAEKDNQYHWMGYCRTGDKVIWVEKLEGHGNLYKVMDNWRFPIFLEDVRLTKFDLKPRETRLSSRQQAAGVKAIERFDMSAELRVEILSRMPLECDKPLRGKDMRGTPEVQMPRNMETATD
jgi:hypothetical protein